MRKLLSVVLISLFAVFSVAAQEDDSEWFWDKNISKIEFNGLNAVKKSDLNAIVNAYTDIPFTEENYNDLMDRLSALDFFDDIEPYANHDPKNANNVIVVLNVKERPTVSLVTFSGNQKIRNGELRDIVKTKTSDIFVEAKVLMDERLIRNLYIEKGYTKETPGMKAIGYSEWFESDSLEEIKAAIIHHSCKYAKKQYTYIKDIPGSEVVSFTASDEDICKVRKIIEQKFTDLCV